MRKFNVRRLSTATLAIAASAALTVGTTSTEAWGGKTIAWDVQGSHSGKTDSQSGKTIAWDVRGPQSGKTIAWD